MSENEIKIVIQEIYNSSKQKILPTQERIELKKHKLRLDTKTEIEEILNLYKDQKISESEIDKPSKSSFSTPSFDEPLLEKLNKIAVKINQELKNLEKETGNDFSFERGKSQMNVSEFNNFLKQLNDYLFEGKSEIDFTDIAFDKDSLELIVNLKEKFLKEQKKVDKIFQNFNKKQNKNLIKKNRIQKEINSFNNFLKITEEKDIIQSPSLQITSAKQLKNNYQKLCDYTDTQNHLLKNNSIK